MYCNNLLLGTTATLGDIPVDILFGCLDRAAFTMQAVLGIDLQLWRVGLFVIDVFIDLGRAETLFGACKHIK